MHAAFSPILAGKNGILTIRAAPNEETQSAIDLVINKTFKHYNIPLHIPDNIWSTFKSKLWCMGKLYAKIGGKARNAVGKSNMENPD